MPFCDTPESLLGVSFLRMQALEKAELGQKENRLRKFALVVFLSDLKDEQYR